MLKYRYTDIFSDIYNQAAKVATNDYGFDFSKVASDKNKKAGNSYFDNMDDFTSIDITDPNSGLDKGKYEKRNGQIYKDGRLLNFDTDQKTQNANNIYAGFNLGTDLIGGVLSQRKKEQRYISEMNKQKMAQDDYDYIPTPYNPYGYNSSLQNNKTLYASSGMEFDPSYDTQAEESFTNSIHDETETQEDYDYNQMMMEYQKELESFSNNDEEDILNGLYDDDEYVNYLSDSSYMNDQSSSNTPYGNMGSLNTKQGVDISKLHEPAKQFINVLASNFPGLKISSGHEGSSGDGIHMKNSKHYQGKAIDIGANSSNKKEYNSFKELIKLSSQELKSQFGIEDIIDEGDHIHIEWE